MTKSIDKLCLEWSHRWFGFFRNGSEVNCFWESHGLPVVTEWIDERWHYPHKKELLDYLERQECIAVPVDPGDVPCLLCKVSHTRRLYAFDGTWLWPASLSHYVQVHSIRLPDAMLAHIERQNFKAPKVEMFDWNQVPWPSPRKQQWWGRILKMGVITFGRRHS